MYKSWMWKQRSFREQHQGDEGNGGAGGTAAAQDDNHASEGEGSDEGEGDEQQQTGEQGGTAEGAANDDAEDEVVVTIGDETPAGEDDEQFRTAPAWVKDLRKADREKSKRIRELEQAIASREASNAPAAPTVGEKPTLESCDYDAEAYADKLVAWNDAKRKADEQAAAARAEQETAQTAWQKKLDGYKAAAAALKVEDFDGAEHVVRETMNPTQLAVMLNGADKPELLVYALGRNPAKAKELAGIKDPVKFAFAVAKLETQLKVQPRKAPPAPERAVRGNAGGSTAVDSTEARLEKEADETGNRTKLIQYRKDKAARAAKAA